MPDDWKYVTIHTHRKVYFPLRCGKHRFWPRKMRFDEDGWYCPVHGLQAYAERGEELL